MKTNLFLLCILVYKSALALPAEGFEAFGFKRNYDKLSQLSINTGYVNPVWTSDYETFQIYNSSPILGTNYLTLGLSSTVANRFADRTSYFMRYDQTFWNQSVSLKLVHTDENFLRTAKNVISATYNGTFMLGKKTQIYVTGGIYYRFNLNTWNTPTWNPINFNTEDREYFFEGTLGLLVPMGAQSSATFDINNRDAFNSYNTDFTAIDIALNLAVTPRFTLRLINSLRMSAFFMGTADVASETIMLGTHILF